MPSTTFVFVCSWAILKIDCHAELLAAPVISGILVYELSVAVSRLAASHELTQGSQGLA